MSEDDILSRIKKSHDGYYDYAKGPIGGERKVFVGTGPILTGVESTHDPRDRMRRGQSS
jgi:hypothetical protein